MSRQARLRLLIDALGLTVILLALADLLRPSLLLLPTITAGGDTPCHYPAAAWFQERLLPSLRLHGWYPGAYLGHPLLLYYFPLPFVLISGLSVVAGLPVAFKLGTALGVFLMPLLVYVSFRLMRWPFPVPLLGATACFVFLFVEDNPIWGGTIASTLTGEFAYTYGVGLAVLFLGVLWRAGEGGQSPWTPAVVLALVASAHGYPVLWAGLTASRCCAGCSLLPRCPSPSPPPSSCPSWPPGAGQPPTTTPGSRSPRPASSRVSCGPSWEPPSSGSPWPLFAGDAWTPVWFSSDLVP
jgi:hypothetical protein